MGEERKPNWGLWGSVPYVRVWEAVALSLAIEPKKIKTNVHSWMAGTGRFLHVEGAQFEDRLEVLRRNLGEENGLPFHAIAAGEPDYCQIPISSFAKWAMLRGWEIPDELKILAGKAAPASLPATKVRESLGASDPRQSSLTAAEKITLAWLWQHVPFGWYWWLGSAFVAVFLAGLSLGQSETWTRLVKKRPPEASSPSRAQPGKPPDQK